MAYEQLDPTTRQKLHELAVRRRTLLLMRAAFAGVLTLLVTMALVATVDRLIVLSQAVRIAMSLTAYGSVVAVVYLVSLRYLLRFPSPAQLAKLIESSEPTLREDLVSAVELAKDAGSMYDSPAFREVLQRKVAKRVERVDTQAVLPWKLIAWWAGVSTGMVVITVALILTPGLRYGDLLTRALMPTAELDRVSDVRITILSPELDKQGRVPMNTDLPVRVEVIGGSFEKVTVEVVDHQGADDDLQMRKETGTDKNFAAKISVGDKPMKFRVRAGDGLTRYYELDPTARPSIAKFSQVIQHPDYTGWNPTRINDSDGSINALVGSVVDLTLSANQPIRSAKLVLELADGEKTFPMYVDPADATVLKTSVPIKDSGPYRVELIALETAFNNDNARRYEIIAMPDKLPLVALDSPKGTTGETTDALLKLTGRAGDDVGLREVAREARVNGGPWQRELVSLSRRGSINAPLDLLPMGLRAGDEVELRLAATDLAGHIAHSTVARVVVTPDGFSQPIIGSTADMRALLRELEETIDLANQAKKKYQAASQGSGIARRQAQTHALIAESQLNDQLDKAGRAVMIALDSSRKGSDADLLVGVGRAVADAKLHLTASPVDVDDNKSMSEAQRSIDEARSMLNKRSTDLRARVAALEMAVIIQQGRALSGDIALALQRSERDRQIDSELGEQRLQRRLAMSVSQAELLTARMKALAKTGDLRNYRDRLEQSADSLKKSLNTHQQALQDNPELDVIHASAGQIHEALIEADKRQWPSWVYTADQDRDEQRRQFSVKQDAEIITRLLKNLKQDKDLNAIGPVIDRLRDRAAIEEARPMPDNSFVALTGVAARGLEQVAIDAEVGIDESTEERLEGIYKAYRTIERVQGLVDLRMMVIALAKAERAGADKQLGLEHRLDWSAIDPRFEPVERVLDREKGLREARDLVRDARHSQEARDVDRAFNDRRDANKPVLAKHEELEAIARMLGEALDKAAPALAEARAELSAQTPSLPKRMRDLAERAEQLSKETEEASAQARKSQEPEVIQRAEQLAKKQERVKAALDALSQELRREANQQDLFTEQGRETARDFDDAIAMLKPDAKEAADQLELAQRDTTREHERPEAIAAAAEAQQDTADTLNQLAEHFENLEKGDPAAEQTRQALRDAEQELGVAQELEEQFKRMEKLAELAQLSDAERLKQLEAQLKQDRNMQRELDKIAGDLAERAQQRLEESAAQERAIADKLNRAAAEAERAIDPTEKAIDDLAQQAQKLQQEKVAPLAGEAQRSAPEAKPEIEQAKKALNQAAAQAEPNAQALQENGAAEEQAGRAQELAESAREAANELKQAAKEAQDAAKSAQQQQEQAQQKAEQAKQQGAANAPQAARDAAQAQEQAQRAQEVQQKAKDAAKQAEQLAKKAEQLNNQVQQQAKQGESQREQGADQQAELAGEAQQASDELARAARHEQRLGEQQRAEQLADASKGTEQLAEQTLPQAADAIGEQGPLAKAEEAARGAEEALNQQADAIEKAQQAQGSEPAGEQSGEQAGEAEGQASGEQAGESQNAEGEQSGEGQGEGESQGEAQGEGEQSGQAEAEGSSEGEGQSEGAGEAEGQGEAQAAGESAGESQGQSQGESQGQGEGQGESPQSGQGEGSGESTEPAPLPGELPQAVAEQLARELDQLDAQLNSDPFAGEVGQSQAQSEGQGEGQSQTQGEGQAQGEGQSESGEDQQAQGQGESQSQGEGQSQAQSEGQSQGEGQGQGQGQSQGESQQAQGEGQGQAEGQSQVQGQGQGEGQGQSQSQAASSSRPIDAAAQAQAQAIRDARMSPTGQTGQEAQPGQPGQPANGQPKPAMAQGQQQGDGDGGGNAADSNFDPAALGDISDDGRRDWGDLPPRIAEDLSRGERQRAPAEYLDQVDAYFRAIARRSREQNKDE